MDTSLVLAAASGIAAAVLFAYVGHRLGTRVVTTPEGRAAFTCFRVWWYAVAATTALTPFRLVLYMTGNLPPWLYIATGNLSVVVVCVALWALLCNLAYLYTGTVRWWGTFATFYFLVGAFFLGLSAWAGEPTYITDDGWSLQAASERSMPLWGALLALLALVGPQLAGALAYMRLLRHAAGRTVRYRIVLVSSSILLWFGSTVAATLLAPEGLLGFLVTRLAGVVSAVLVLFAYDPPAALRRRLGVKRAGEETPQQPSIIAKAAKPMETGTSQ
ncbi:MAG: hypothetical protein ABR562_06015 [Thermoplasmatota archaeon]|nr:hypothetical protein [Halobacteriales archaeon]